MPIEYFVDGSKDLLVTTASGVICDFDIVFYMKRLIEDPRYRSGMDGLVFTEAIEDFEVTASGIAQVVEIATPAEGRFAGSRWAIVAGDDPVFGMTRMFELRRAPESHDVRVFREEASAIEWLRPTGSEAGNQANQAV